jgi:uncharacterized peroxidase-related enzyme
MKSSSIKKDDTCATTLFNPLTKETAPKDSLDALNRLEKSVGGIPNLAAAMANSPALIDGFVSLREIVQKRSSFSPLERELVFIVNATANACGYCQAVHSMFAAKAGLDQETIDAIRAEEPLKDQRLSALAVFARGFVKNKGHVKSDETAAFLAAGFDKSQILDIVACVAQSVMANYGNHVLNVEPDDFIKPQYKAAG